ncbi:MAG: NAD(P)-dependent oxidoreductase [Armatimonadetes bacterium]|nr:NAD(P)-dependent oxidoreductase [Armatimonadota bacterium]
MKVLITGITGFVGSQVARHLINGGHEVHGIIMENDDCRRIDDIMPSVGVVTGNLNDLDSLAPALEAVRPDVCIHLAWYVEPGKYLPSFENLSSLHATGKLAELMGKMGCGKFVGAGTCFEYDLEYGYLSESTPTKPESLYAACKVAAEGVVSRIGDVTGMRVAWPRLFYQYGPFEDPRRLVAFLITSLMRGEDANVSKGTQIRDFLHVEDVGAAIAAVALSDLTGPVNVGSGVPVTVRQIVWTIAEALGRPELVHFGARQDNPTDPPFVCANNRKLIEGTDWSPKYSLEEGLRQTIEWWKKASLGK